MSRAMLVALCAAVLKSPEWPQHNGKPYPCSVSDINTTNGTISVVKLDDAFFRPQGGNAMVVDQLQAQWALAKEAVKLPGARVSTFYKDKDGNPRPGFQISIIPGAGQEQEQSVENRLATMWSEVMDKLPEDEVDQLVEKLSSKPDGFVLAKLQRALAAIPVGAVAAGQQEQSDEDGEQIPF